MPHPGGRPPMPTKLKILTGNRGKRPLPTHEPQPARGIPPCPAWLDAEAKAKWEQLAPELDRLGLLTVVDGDFLTAYCQAWGEFLWATETLREEGRVMDTRTGQRAHPAAALQRSAWVAMQRFGGLFGLSPADRVKLATPGGGEKDEFEAFLQEKQA
jgi:P27 family predicted phage terminase small subunit